MRFKTLAAWLTAIACQLPADGLLAQEVTAYNEYQVKAALLYNFSVFTEWPVMPPEAFDFCILGKDPFGSWLDKIARKTVQGKAIHIRRIGASEDIRGCHLLF
ncbi:MAG: YfiR family protein, partial [Pseudomonadota bacterium]